LIQRVTRRAEKLRNVWANHESTGSRRQLSFRSATHVSVS
jgi:hypothetical protein